jgi:hypothetical protein
VWSSLRLEVLDIVVWRWIINMADEDNLSMTRRNPSMENASLVEREC